MALSGRFTQLIKKGFEIVWFRHSSGSLVKCSVIISFDVGTLKNMGLQKTGQKDIIKTIRTCAANCGQWCKNSSILSWYHRGHVSDRQLQNNSNVGFLTPTQTGSSYASLMGIPSFNGKLIPDGWDK